MVLRVLREIKQDGSKEAGGEKGPRLIDNGFLLYNGSAALDTPELQVPHRGCIYGGVCMHGCAANCGGRVAPS